MSWHEVLDITPGEFIAMNREWAEQAKSEMLGFQFLATVVARIAGSKDANFMPESDRPQGWTDEEGGLFGFLEARVADHGEKIDPSGEPG